MFLLFKPIIVFNAALFVVCGGKLAIFASSIGDWLSNLWKHVQALLLRGKRVCKTMQSLCLKMCVLCKESSEDHIAGRQQQ